MGCSPDPAAPPRAAALPRVSGVGLDVGSTTAKLVALRDGVLIHRAYVRHRGHCLAAAEALLEGIPGGAGGVRFITGSAGAALAEALGGVFVHEVHAVAKAARLVDPRVRTVIELGGQDGKLLELDEAGGLGSEMNERCAAGTGATIDRCLGRLGLGSAALEALLLDEGELPVVSAKCGVFAEADLVALVRSGLAPERALLALLDGIVRGGLAVLARGRALAPPVLLLGGPHAFIPALAALWRRHLMARWGARGLVGRPEEVVVPEGAALFAAVGALACGDELGRIAAAGGGEGRGGPRPGRLGLARRPLSGRERGGLITDGEELAPILARHRLTPPPPAAHGPLTLGLDAGSTTLKAVAIDEAGLPVASLYRPAGGQPIAEAVELLAALGEGLGARAADLAGIGLTGYAADLLAPILGADATPVETLAHARSAVHFVPDAEVVCDVGGQDIKILFLDGGQVRRFQLSHQCAAGNGALLEATARDLGIPLSRAGEVALTARRAPLFSVGCAVFLDSERVTAQRDGYAPGEILAGMAAVLPRNIWENVVAAPSLRALGQVFVLSGGVQRNAAAVKAQLDYLAARHPGARIHLHPFPGEAGALGAALAAQEALRRRPSRFVGLPRLREARFRVERSEAERCRLCPSTCPRSVTTVERPGAIPERLVSGHGCDRGADIDQKPKILAHRGRDLLRLEAAWLFQRPAIERPRTRAGRALRLAFPRVLSLYRSAPLFLHYFAAIGVERRHLLTSPATSPALWRRAAGRGTVDACFPAKVALAHLAELAAARRRHPFDAIFFPVLTHAVTCVTGCADTASCPVVAGTPLLARAAFGADDHGRLADGTLLLTPTLVLTRPDELRDRLFAVVQALAPELTVGEHEAALEDAKAAQRAFEGRLEEQGEAAIAQAASEQHCAVVMLGRPYHADPGLHHHIGAELAALGRTTLSLRALPKRPAALSRLGLPTLFDLAGDAPFFTNSGDGEKLAAARLVASHRHLVAIEVSSFKCGQDASLYGAVAELAQRGGKPFLALHDLDETRPLASLRLRLRTFLAAVDQWEERRGGGAALPAAITGRG